MDVGGLAELIHVLIGGALVGGIVGRNVAMRRAARSDDVREIHALLGVTDVLERVFVIPPSALIVITGLATAWLTGLPILGFLIGQRPSWPLVSLLLVLSIGMLVPTIFRPRGRIFAAALADATGRGIVTPELRAVFADRVVAAARTYEVVVIVVVVALMVLKPF